MKSRARMLAFAAVVFGALAATAEAGAATCSKQSPAHAVALLELYTSEGCDSCPPADRWLSRLSREGVGADQVVPLAFHVDYWDRLGWKDRFASARYGERQQELARAAGSRAVYTPGMFLHLDEFRGWSSPARFQQALRAINSKAAGADIRLELDSSRPARLEVKANFHVRATPARPAKAFVALYENRLSTRVAAGENRGATLHHDYVVRDWIGPIAVDGAAAFRQLLVLDGQWKAKDLGVAALIQDAASRDILQATALAVCSPT